MSSIWKRRKKLFRLEARVTEAKVMIKARKRKKREAQRKNRREEVLVTRKFYICGTQVPFGSMTV